MDARTVNWATLGDPRVRATTAEGLREQKKRLMRQQLSDTATEMFMERGFDAVRVSEVAAACGVSEKTVFNYFPTKESLLLDRWDFTMASLRKGLANPDISPVEVALQILADELGALTSWLTRQRDWVQASMTMRRFGDLIRSAPSLRAYQHDTTDRLIALAAELMAERAGMRAEDPEPQIAATALLGLWNIQFQSLRKHLDGTRAPAQVHEAATADVRRAARLVDTGLGLYFSSAAAQDFSSAPAQSHLL
jgi:AcrR family transcriptional regulator